jgi:acetylornithine deacetylase
VTFPPSRPASRDPGAAAVELTRRLVAIDSVNPGLVPGAAGEAAIAAVVADRLAAAGFDVTRQVADGQPERVSVLAVRDAGPGRCVVLNGHLDTVGVDGMADPFTARIDGDRMTGRGTCDMKAGVAGLVVAAEQLAAAGVPGRLVVALVADEEDASIGTAPVLRALAERGIDPDVCLVGEPTGLDLAVAHRGYAGLRVTMTGRPAHTSQPGLGVDAVAHLARFLVALAGTDRMLQEAVADPMLGHGSWIASVVSGGTAPFTVAARAQATVERRTLPGESGPVGDDGTVAAAEVRRMLESVAPDDPRVVTTTEMLLHRAAWRADADGAAADLMAALTAALPGAGGRRPDRIGAPYWMESALWQAAGVPAVVCGPAGGGLHALDEWVDVGQVRRYPVAVAEAVGSVLSARPTKA